MLPREAGHFMNRIFDTLKQVEASASALEPARMVASSTEDPRDDTFGRLADAVASWDLEILEAREGFGQRLNRLRQRVENLAAHLASTHEKDERSAASALEDAQDRILELTDKLLERDRALAAASATIRDGDEKREALAKEVQHLTTALKEQAETEREMKSDLDRVRGALVSARDQLTAAREGSGRADESSRQFEAAKSRAEMLDAALAAKQRELETAQDRARSETLRRGDLADQLAAALRDRDEAHQQIVALRSEIDLLKRANASLCAPAIEATDNDDTAPDVTAPDGSRQRMGEILIKLGFITSNQLDDALAAQAETPHRRIGSILIERGMASEEAVAQVLARQLDLPFVRLTSEVVDGIAPRLINGQLARRRQCIPITAATDRVVLAMANPLDLIAVDDVELASGRRVAPVVATGSDIYAAIGRYYGAQ